MDGGTCIAYPNSSFPNSSLPWWNISIPCDNNTMLPNSTLKPGFGMEPKVTNLFYFIVNNIIIFLILSGNITTIWIFSRYKQMRNVTSLFIISLACADLIMGCIYILYNLLNYTTYLYSLRNMKAPCLSCLYFIIISAGVSNFGLLLVTIDRYIAVAHPLTYYTKVTYKRASIAILSMWIYISLASLSMIPVYGINLSEYYNMSCSLLNLIPKWYFFGIIVPHMLIPNIINKVIYCRILYIAKKQARRIYKENQLFSGTKTISSKERKSTITMAIIIVLFFICWAPYITLHIVIHSIGRESPDYLYNMLEVSKLFSLSNSFINPIVYAWRNKDFRYAVKLRCKDWGGNTVTPSRTQSRLESIDGQMSSSDTTVCTPKTIKLPWNAHPRTLSITSSSKLIP